MKKLLLAALLGFLSTSVHAALGTGVGGISINFIQDEGSTITQRNILNFIGSPINCVDNSTSTRIDCTVLSSTSSGTATPLEVFSSFDATRTSPTASISIGDGLKLTVSGSTAIINIDFSSVTSRSDVILNRNTLQTGATFYVSSGSVNGQLNVFNGNIRTILLPSATEAMRIINISSHQVFMLIQSSGTIWWRIGSDVTGSALLPSYDIYNSTTGIKDITISTNDVITINGTMAFAPLTASRPLKLNSSKQVTSGLIDLITDVTGTLPSTNLPSNVVYTNVQQTISASKVFTASQTFNDLLVANSTFVITGSTLIISGTTYYWRAGSGGSDKFLMNNAGVITSSTPAGTGGGGGSTSPGGSNTNVQYNSGGLFAGDNGLQYDSSVSSLTVAGKFSFDSGNFQTDSSGIYTFTRTTAVNEPTLRLQNLTTAGFGANKCRFDLRYHDSVTGTTDVSLEGMDDYASIEKGIQLRNRSNGNINLFVGDDKFSFGSSAGGGGGATLLWDATNITASNPWLFTSSETVRGNMFLENTRSATSLATDSTGKIIAGSGGGSAGSSTATAVAYGALYTSSTNITQTGISTTPVKLNIFDVNGISNGTTPDQSIDQILITTAAIYSVYFAVYSTGTGIFENYFWVAVNGSTQAIKCSDTPSARCSNGGVLSLVAGSSVTLYGSASVAGTTITVQSASLSLHSVGSTSGSSSSGGGGGYAVEPATVTIQASKGLFASSITVNGDQFSFLPYLRKVDKYSGSAGFCTLSTGCVSVTQYASTTNITNFGGPVFPSATTSYWNLRAPLPENYVNGSTFTVSFVWTSTSATGGNVVWNTQMKDVQSGQTMDLTWGSVVSVTDSLTTTGSEEFTVESSAITAANSPVGKSSLFVQVYRGVSASDTLAGDAVLEEIDITYLVDELSGRD